MPLSLADRRDKRDLKDEKDLRDGRWISSHFEVVTFERDNRKPHRSLSVRIFPKTIVLSVVCFLSPHAEDQSGEMAVVGIGIIPCYAFELGLKRALREGVFSAVDP